MIMTLSRTVVDKAYGDLGDANSVSLAAIQEHVENGFNIDAVLHVGDFGK